MEFKKSWQLSYIFSRNNKMGDMPATVSLLTIEIKIQKTERQNIWATQRK